MCGVEIDYWGYKDPMAERHGFLEITTLVSFGPDPTRPPSSTPPPNLGTVPPTKICFAIGSLTERESVSVPANKFDLLRRTFAGRHTRLPPSNWGTVPSMQNVFCDWLLNGER